MGGFGPTGWSSPNWRLLGCGLAFGAVLAAPTSSLAQSVTATNTYDDAGRLRTTSYSDGKAVGYALDAAGNRTSTAEGTLPQISIAPASASEGGALVFTVTKSGTAVGTVTVDCAQADGSATAGADYTAATQTLTFLMAETVKSCSVTTLQDVTYEGTHVFSAVLQNPTGAVRIAISGAVGTITDDDTPPSFAVSGGSAVEGLPVPFTISKTGSTELSHSVGFATADGSATTADNDYSAVGSSHSFAPGETSFVVTVPTTVDSKYELNETLALNLSNPTNGATISGSQATGTITNNDPAPTFSVNSPAAVNEGSLITFTLTRSGNTNTGVTHSFDWATANNTAVAPGDFTAGSGSITFATTDSQKTIQVQTLTDGVVDSASNETFFLNLATNAGTNGGTIAMGQGTGTIADIDSSVPSVPANIRKSPTSGNGWVYSILWDASTGPVDHYTLEEVESAPGSGTTTYPVTATYKAFNKGEVYLQLVYRVRACATTNESQCSAYSGTVFKQVCPSSGCP